jgi:thioredoxin reductase/NAD-dependent dihydropyrimidine dehydrogenase PreA subunit
MTDFVSILIYGTPFGLILWLYVRRRHAHHRESVEVKHENVEAGLVHSASLHPLIDPRICIGCGACVAACPEMPGHQVLGLVRRKAELIGPTECIGHGACKTACPVGAISLVFGSSERGVDIPNVDPDFQTNVRGIYIAGELGGMGLIKNAIEQGKQAMASIVKRSANVRSKADTQVAIIGAGPTGIAASLTAMQAGMSYCTIEQDSLGGTVASFPKRKLVMTAPVELPLVGKVKFSETTKEELVEFWRKVEEKTGLQVSYGEYVQSVRACAEDMFEIVTSRRTLTANSVLLAIGRRGTPRKLGVPGEELSKVTYKLIDPEQYTGLHVLIVGGGDSALESAITISEEPGTTVTLSYRSAAFGRAKKKNRERLQDAQDKGRLTVLLESNVATIADDSVEIDHKGKIIRIPNDAVIVNAGGILPTGFLREVGIEIETKFGTA